jgi:beta-galactosidase
VKLVLEHDGDLVKVKAVDASGVLCLDAANEIEFSIAGNGRLLDDLGTVGGSRKVQLANGQASIRIAVNDGPVVVAAAGKGLETGMVQLKK